MGKINPFTDILKKENLSHAYLCLGDFNYYKNDFEDSLNNLGIKINTPGNFIFIGNTFSKDDADQINSWYNKNITADANYTICLIASSVIKTEAQQLLLKIFEEARSPYVFFLFTPHGTEVLPTIKSRCSLIELKNVNPINDGKEIANFISISAGDRIKYVSEKIKNKESPEIRIYTEELVRGLINYFHTNGFEKNPPNNNLGGQRKNILENLLKAQNSLATGHIAPKFILDYVVTIL